ncbi:MAG: ABC transporter permease [Lactobacillus amylovorus]|nr:ABC transporter permease [Lactobacillus amylovorus]
MNDQAVKSTYYDATIIENSPAVQKNVDKLDIKTRSTYHYVETKKDVYFDKSEFEKTPLRDVKFKQNGNNFPIYKPGTLKTSELTMKDSYAGNVLRIQTNTLGKTVKLVSSNQLKNIQGQKKFITLITVKDFVKDYLTLMKLEKVQLASNPAMAQALSRTKPFSYQMILGFTSGFEFMGFFLGIAFLTMLASTLMFKVLSGAASDKMRYEMLYKIGTRRKVLKQSIRHEIGVLFLLPGILGVIDVLFGLRLFTALLPHPYMGFWVPFSIFIVLYFIYYAVTVKLYENLVLQK